MDFLASSPKAFVLVLQPWGNQRSRYTSCLSVNRGGYVITRRDKTSRREHHSYERQLITGTSGMLKRKRGGVNSRQERDYTQVRHRARLKGARKIVRRVGERERNRHYGEKGDFGLKGGDVCEDLG